MRMLVGIILGAFLTIAGAYTYDAATGATGPGAAERPMVNWDVVGVRMQQAKAEARAQWAKLRTE
jgi:hypothetical protein